MTPRPYKADAIAIQEFLSELESRTWLGHRKWWPRYAFHYSDVRNIASILNGGHLYSRSTAKEKKLLRIDCASQGVIACTPEPEQRWVRMYFRPLTPTQFRNEGFRPVGQRWDDAHCPVPVFLLFRSRELLAREGTHFTSGSVARIHEKGTNASFLRRLRFQDIYHDRGYGFANPIRDRIAKARHSEILVEEPLSLENLQAIVCRSEAERLTLIALLEDDVRDTWYDRIVLQREKRLFNKEWTHIERVVLGRDGCTIHISPDTEGSARGPFHLKFHLLDPDTGTSSNYEDSNFHIRLPILRWDYQQEYHRYILRITLDGDLAYKSNYIDDTPVVV